MLSLEPMETETIAEIYPAARLCRMSPADQLRRWRTHNGLTQAQAAERIGCDQSIVSRVERGHRSAGVWSDRIAEVTGVDFPA